jgi:hypothetical protein
MMVPCHHGTTSRRITVHSQDGAKQRRNTMATVTVRDRTVAGDEFVAITLELLTERIDARELIRSRVYQEVSDANAARVGRWREVFAPEEREAALNGDRPAHRQLDLDPEKQFRRALEAFERGRLLLLVDGRQIERLDEPLTLRPDSDISFLRIVPLAGG